MKVGINSLEGIKEKVLEKLGSENWWLFFLPPSFENEIQVMKEIETTYYRDNKNKYYEIVIIPPNSIFESNSLSALVFARKDEMSYKEINEVFKKFESQKTLDGTKDIIILSLEGRIDVNLYIKQFAEWLSS